MTDDNDDNVDDDDDDDDAWQKLKIHVCKQPNGISS